MRWVGNFDGFVVSKYIFWIIISEISVKIFLLQLEFLFFRCFQNEVSELYEENIRIDFLELKFLIANFIFLSLFREVIFNRLMTVSVQQNMTIFRYDSGLKGFEIEKLNL